MSWLRRRRPKGEESPEQAAPPMRAPVSTGFLSDDPRDGSTAKPDDLGRAAFVDHVAALLSSVRDQSPSSVIGLTGDWGSGKSTVLQMVLRRLKAGDGAQRWLVAEFNPWTYPDTEAMQRGFFAELKSVLPEELQGGSAREATLSSAASCGCRYEPRIRQDREPQRIRHETQRTQLARNSRPGRSASRMFFWTSGVRAAITCSGR